jgi:hypothetical protein
MAETKRSRGRPKGSGHGQSIVLRVRAELEKSLDILESDDRPLAMLLADQLKQDAAKTLNAIGKFVPTDVRLEHTGENLIGALEQIGSAIDEQLTQAKAAELSRLSVNETDGHNLPEPAEILEKKDVN